jgi:hypothetical protein
LLELGRWAQPTGLRERLFSSQPKPGNYEVTLDTSRQVLRLDIPEDYEYDFASNEPCLYPSFAEAGLDASKFAPAAVLALKAKHFDDGLYACVEMAADAGLGRLTAKKEEQVSDETKARRGCLPSAIAICPYK